jgi:hypothetical protein
MQLLWSCWEDWRSDLSSNWNGDGHHCTLDRSCVSISISLLPAASVQPSSSAQDRPGHLLERALCPAGCCCWSTAVDFKGDPQRRLWVMHWPLYLHLYRADNRWCGRLKFLLLRRNLRMNSYGSMEEPMRSEKLLSGSSREHIWTGYGCCCWLWSSLSDIYIERGPGLTYFSRK